MKGTFPELAHFCVTEEASEAGRERGRTRAHSHPPRFLSPRSRRRWGGFQGSVEQRRHGGGFSQRERWRGPGSSSSCWSCLHTSWDGELTACRLPVVNSARCSSLAAPPEYPPAHAPGSLRPNLWPAVALSSSPPPEVRLGPGWTPWAGPWASARCMSLPLLCPEWVVPATLGLTAGRAAGPETPSLRPHGNLKRGTRSASWMPRLLSSTCCVSHPAWRTGASGERKALTDRSTGVEEQPARAPDQCAPPSARDGCWALRNAVITNLSPPPRSPWSGQAWGRQQTTIKGPHPPPCQQNQLQTFRSKILHNPAPPGRERAL